MRLVNEWMVDFADGGTGLDTSITIDGKDFAQATGKVSRGIAGKGYLRRLELNEIEVVLEGSTYAGDSG